MQRARPDLARRGAARYPLRAANLLRKHAGGYDLDLTWAAACGDGDDYAIYERLLRDAESKAPVQCSTGGATSATITPS
jgi:hypothetical protein